MFIFSILTCAISRNQFYTAVHVRGMCVCCIYSLGHYALQSCEEGYRARGGNRWLQAPSPFLSPPCLSVSFIPSMVDLSAWQAGRPAVLTLLPETRGKTVPEGWVSSRLKTPLPVPPLFRRPLGSGNYSCVSVSGQSSQGVPRTHKLIHTTSFQQGGKVIGFADSRVASEKFVGSLTLFQSFIHTLSYTSYNFGIFNLGDLVQQYFYLFSSSFGCVSQNRPSRLLVLRSFVFVWVSFGLFFWVIFWGSGSEPDSKDKRNVAGLFWSLVFCLFCLLSYSVLCEKCIERLRECLCERQRYFVCECFSVSLPWYLASGSVSAVYRNSKELCVWKDPAQLPKERWPSFFKKCVFLSKYV